MTGHFGKWHLGTLTKTEKDANRGGPLGVKNLSPPQANGFDVCFSTESKVPTYDPMLRPKGNKSNKCWDPAKENVSYGTGYWDEKGKRVTENLRGDNSRVIMDRAIPFIRAAAKKQKAILRNRLLSHATLTRGRGTGVHKAIPQAQKVRTTLRSSCRLIP